MKIYDYEGRKNICGENVRKLRREKEMTQADLASRLQLQGVTIDRFSIAKIEVGSRFVADYELAALANALHVTIEDLLGK